MTEKRYLTCSKISSGKLLEFARYNRQHPTDAEYALWHSLKEQIIDIKFRRQHIVGPYIVDFICLSHNLVIEIDGGYHFEDEQREADEKRDDYLNAIGLEVMHFTNEEVLHDRNCIIDRIKKYIIKELK